MPVVPLSKLAAKTNNEYRLPIVFIPSIAYAAEGIFFVVGQMVPITFLLQRVSSSLSSFSFYSFLFFFFIYIYYIAV
jgi:hypothetical protein